MGRTPWSSRPHKEPPHMEARSSLLSCGSQRPVFHLSLDFLLLLLLLHHLWKVCLFSPRSLLWLRRWGHGAQWWAGFRVQISALICSFQAAFSFLPSCLREVCSLYRHFLLSPRRSRRCNLFIGAVKSTTKGLMNSTHNSRKCPDSALSTARVCSCTLIKLCFLK